MADTKSLYSEVSHYYVEEKVLSSAVDRGRYERSKERERKYNENWKKTPVNINEIVDRFAPGDDGHEKGVKYIFEGPRYQVRADMVAGYLRIYDKAIKKFVKIDRGLPDPGEEPPHYKILKREEM